MLYEYTLTIYSSSILVLIVSKSYEPILIIYEHSIFLKPWPN